MEVNEIEFYRDTLKNIKTLLPYLLYLGKTQHDCSAELFHNQNLSMLNDIIISLNLGE